MQQEEDFGANLGVDTTMPSPEERNLTATLA